MKTNWKITYFGRLGICCIVFKLFNQNIQYYVTKLKENCFLCKSEIEQFQIYIKSNFLLILLHNTVYFD